MERSTGAINVVFMQIKIWLENSIQVLILQVMKEHQFILLYKARSGQLLTWETQIMVSVTVEKAMVGCC